MLWHMLRPLLIYQIISSLVFFAGTAVAGATATKMTLLLAGVSAGIAILPLGMLYLKQCVGKQTRSVCLWSAAAGAGACLALNYVMSLIPLTSAAYEKADQAIFAPPLWIQILCTGLVIPLAEELIFRGLAYTEVRREHSFGTAAFVSAVYFGLFHGNMVQGIYALILGLMLAWLFERSGRLSSVWAFHAAANLTSVAFTAWTNRRGMVEKNNFTLGAVLAVVGMAVLFYAFYRIREVTEYEATFHSNSML